MNSAIRIAVASLSLSAMGIVGLAVHEGWAPEAMVPTTGDRMTLGFGMTHRPDGSPVRAGDRTDPIDALKRTLAYTQAADAQIKACVTVPLHQAEYDLLADFGYQYGVGALCKSSIVSRVNAGDYAGSCEAYLKYRFAAGYDCSTLIDGKPNKRCWGVWTRQQKRHAACMAVQ